MKNKEGLVNTYRAKIVSAHTIFGAIRVTHSIGQQERAPQFTGSFSRWDHVVRARDFSLDPAEVLRKQVSKQDKKNSGVISRG